MDYTNNNVNFMSFNYFVIYFISFEFFLQKKPVLIISNYLCSKFCLNNASQDAREKKGHFSRDLELL